MAARQFTGRLMAIPSPTEVDLKIYLEADVGFGFTYYAGTHRNRFKMLGLNKDHKHAMAFLAEHAMDRNIGILVHKSLRKGADEYAVELVDLNTGVNFNDAIQRL